MQKLFPCSNQETQNQQFKIMIAVFRMSSEKKEKYIKKLDKMVDFIEEFRECLEETEDYDDDWDDEPSYRSNMRKGSTGMKSRYSRRG